MERLAYTPGVFEVFVPSVLEYSIYKFYITTQAGQGIYKMDPYGNYCQLRAETASVVFDSDKYMWKDKRWLMHLC